MREIDKVKQFIRNIIKREPAILADWLEDRFVPGTDMELAGECLDSLHRNKVIVVRKCPAFAPREEIFTWDGMTRWKLRDGFSREPYPDAKKSSEKLYMLSASGSTTWMFYWPKKRPVVNPLLFALASLAYGWTTHPLAERALYCLNYQPK